MTTRGRGRPWVTSTGGTTRRTPTPTRRRRARPHHHTTHRRRVHRIWSGRRPRRKQTATLGSVLVALLAAVAYLTVSLIWLAVTVVVGLTVGLLVLIGEPETPQQGPVSNKGNRSSTRTRPVTPPAPGAQTCGQPTKGKGDPCRNSTLDKDGRCWRHPATKAGGTP